MERFSKCLQVTTSAGVWVGAAFLVGNMLLVVGSILYRLLAGALVMGVYEMIELSITVPVFFALCYATLVEEHVTVRILSDKLPPRLRALAEVFTRVLSLGFWTLLAISCYVVISDKLITGEETQELRIPVLPFRFVFLVAMVLCALIALRDVVRAMGHVSLREG